MDRDADRLQEVRTSDLNESRLNEDFVHWLRTRGVWWATGIVLAVAVYFFVVGQRQRAADERSQAWRDLAVAALPESLEDVARQHADTDAISSLARLRAATVMLDAVRRNRPVGADLLAGLDAAAANETLSDEERSTYLERADRLFEEVAATDDGTLATTLAVHNALMGRAAIAEALGEGEQARTLYERAAARAETDYPVLAEQARERAETAERYAAVAGLPDQQSATQVRRAVAPRNRAAVMPALEPYLPGGPDEDGDDS